MAAEGHDTDEFEKKIRDIAVKHFIAMYDTYQASKSKLSMSLVALDFIIDSSYTPYLCESNINPMV